MVAKHKPAQAPAATIPSDAVRLADGTVRRLRFDVNAFCQYEAFTGAGILEAIAEFQDMAQAAQAAEADGAALSGGAIRFSTLRALYAAGAGLEDLLVAGREMTEAGLGPVIGAIGAAVVGSLPEATETAEAEDAAGN